MKRTVLIFAVLALAATGALAQNHSVEYLGGFAVQPFTLKGEARTALGMTAGGDVHFRYTYFIDEHWGAFAQIGSEMSSAGEGSFFGTMNRADGDKYLYRFSNYRGYDSELDVFVAGAAYRWDAGIFRFTPRVGVGYGTFYGYDYSYERRSRDGSTGPEFFNISPSGDVVTYDYLIDHYEYYDDASVMVFTADFQISVMPTKRFYVFVQPGMSFTPFRVNVEQCSYGSKHMYEPSNWAESLAYGDKVDAWTKDPDSEKVSVDSFGISPYFHLNFGVGINFGYKNNR